jgi:RHS repeat-associated protein
MTYDANGNLLTQGGGTYGYDSAEMLTSRPVTGGNETYKYGPDNVLLRRTNPGNSAAFYIEGVYERNLASGGVVTGVTKYYSALGRPLAIRQAAGDGQLGSLYFPLADQLGSTAGVTDQTGALIAGTAVKYWPYGAVRSGSITQTDRLFTNQRQEVGTDALGLYNYNARFYSTTLGRFVSADPVPALNRYAYGAGNPTRFVDPTGLYLVASCGWTQTCTKAGNSD